MEQDSKTSVSELEALYKQRLKEMADNDIKLAVSEDKSKSGLEKFKSTKASLLEAIHNIKDDTIRERILDRMPKLDPEIDMQRV